nr:hydroxymethylglutaryl-CoA lyase [Cryptococcus depauperatus CBS 7841]
MSCAFFAMKATLRGRKTMSLFGAPTLKYRAFACNLRESRNISIIKNITESSPSFVLQPFKPRSNTNSASARMAHFSSLLSASVPYLHGKKMQHLVARRPFSRSLISSQLPSPSSNAESESERKATKQSGRISRELMTFPSCAGRGQYIRIVEVSPRDGLQNLKGKLVPTHVKKELVERLLNAGVRNIEVGSFVRGDWVPQMADTPKLLPLLPPYSASYTPPSPTLRSESPFSGRPSTPTITPHTVERLPREANNVHYPVLVPNMKGLDNLLKLQEEWKGKGLGNLSDEIAVFVSATEAFSQANNHASVEKVLSSLPAVINKARSYSLRVRGYVSCVITDPYTGPTSPDEAVDVAERLLNMGCYEVSMGDTTGEGDPASWGILWKRMKERGIDMNKVAAHCHDTFSLALPSILSLVPLGLATIDSSLAGLGGCPYSPGATGNVPTEDVVYALHKMGYETGIDLDKLVEAGEWIAQSLGVRNESRVGRALAARRRAREEKDAKASNEETEDGM